MADPHFPCWKYHKTQPARIVSTPEAEAALGAGWWDSPADVDGPSVDPNEAAVPTHVAAAVTDETDETPGEASDAPEAPKRRGRPPKNVVLPG